MDLPSLSICFIDCQSTGANPSTSELLELAFDDYTFLAQTSTPISKKIQSLTGITPSALTSSVAPAVLVRQLSEYISSKNTQWIVSHFARFEKALLDRIWLEHLGVEFPIPFICTHQLAKRLHADLPSYGLRAVAGWYGDPLHEHKRARDHVAATKLIWRRMVEELAARGITTINQLSDFLAAKPAKSSERKSYHIDREKRLSLPTRPGVYRYVAKNGRILYVGKATSLRHRVNSYFTGGLKRDARKREMLAQAVDVDVTTVSTPLHAGMLEYDEIQTHQPPYNKMFRGESVAIEDDLQVLVKDPSTLTCDDLVTASRHLFYGIDSLETLTAGLSAWRLQIDHKSEWSYRTLVRLGLPLLKEWIGAEKQRRLASNKDTEEEETETEIDEEEIEVEFVWTPELVAAEATSWTRRAARDYFKRRYLKRLQGATIEQPQSELIYVVNADQDYRRAKVLLHEMRRAESKGEPWVVVKPWPMQIPFWV